MDKKAEITKMLGGQYYKWLDKNTLDLVRVVSILSDGYVKVLNAEFDIVKMKAEDILKDYLFIQPDGAVTVSIVDMGKDSKGYNVEDIIVALYRTKEINENDIVPFAVCRQNINDFFYNYMSKTQFHDLVGVSVSRNSCPENIDFRIMTACNNVKNSTFINIYMEDIVDSILSFCKVKPINNVLESLFQQRIKYAHSIDVGQKEIDGYCRTIKDLLEQNNFQFDFDSAFNILSLNIKLEDYLYEVTQKFGNETITIKTLPDDIIYALSTILNKQIKDTIVEPYTREVAIEDLEGTNFIILRDSVNRLYIVSYTNIGEYRVGELANRYQDPVTRLDEIFAFCKDKIKNYDK